MKKTLLALLIALPLVSTLSGCVVAVGGDGKDGYNYSFDYEDRQLDNRRNIANLQLKMGFDQVKNLMGVPDFNETYEKNGETIQVLYYRTQRTKKDGITTKDECTPLIFKQSILSSWGEMAYKQI